MIAESELPRLTSAEFVARFGSDEDALRRYRILVALLREGRSTSEVARAFDTSCESLRRLRLAFRRDGLLALQRRKPGGGHFARGSPLAQAIQQELASDPHVSPSTLWHRVKMRLQEQGLTAPRSTFYRLLARLRDEQVAAGSGEATVGLLREALHDLAENPPLRLGRSGLAALLLPHERNLLRRGRWLQDVLRVAIEQLRPFEAGPVLDDPHWRHYLILVGEYEAGEDRAALQETLALSASTYSRAKREALERLAGMLPSLLEEQPPPDPPALLIAPPEPPVVFHHEPELEQYLACLRRDGMVLIWGPAGVGKYGLATMLAARLQARGQRVVWHSCQPPEVEAHTRSRLLMTLAAALALDGKEELWNAITGTAPATFGRRLELLAEGLVGRYWTIMVVNTQWLLGDSVARVVDVLTAAQERRDIRLVLVGRERPAWGIPERWPPLPFPSDIIARRTFVAQLAQRSLVFPTESHAQVEVIRERVAELLAVIPSATRDSLSAEQAAQIQAALRPVEAVAAELRVAVLPNTRVESVLPHFLFWQLLTSGAITLEGYLAHRSGFAHAASTMVCEEMLLAIHMLRDFFDRHPEYGPEWFEQVQEFGGERAVRTAGRYASDVLAGLVIAPDSPLNSSLGRMALSDAVTHILAYFFGDRVQADRHAAGAGHADMCEGGANREPEV